MKTALDEPTIRATVIAHAIRLGKCPPPGTPVDFLFSLQQGDSSMIETGDTTGAIDLIEPRRVGFTVAAEDIENAKALINGQQITYKEPKLSLLWLKENRDADRAAE